MPSLSQIFRRLTGKPDTVVEKRAQEKQLSKYEQAKLSFERLGKINSFCVMKAGSTSMLCTDKDISSFYGRLTRYRDALAAREKITPAMCFGELHTVRLDNFFTTPEGMYVNQGAISIVRQILEEIFVMLDAERLREGGQTYTERLLSKTFTSIISLEEATSKSQ